LWSEVLIVKYLHILKDLTICKFQLTIAAITMALRMLTNMMECAMISSDDFWNVSPAFICRNESCSWSRLYFYVCFISRNMTLTSSITTKFKAKISVIRQ